MREGAQRKDEPASEYIEALLWALLKTRALVGQKDDSEFRNHLMMS